MSDDAKVRGVCDIMFLLDATGTMKPCIDQLMENIAVFVSSMESQYLEDWRCTVWGYRDVLFDKERWLERNPFVRDVPSLRAQFAALKARGGGDVPESLLDALYTAATLPSTAKGEPEDTAKWRYRSSAARVIIVFTDAPFHPTMAIPEAVGGTVADVANAITSNRFTTVFYAPSFDCFDDIALMDKAEFEAVCAGDDPDPPKALVTFTQDKANFTKTLQALARTVTKSAAVEEL